MLCRSILESTLAAAFEAHRAPQPATMRQRLSSAAERGWLSRSGERSAWTVWLRGNKVLHDDPFSVADARETIALTLAVVRELTNSPPSLTQTS